MVKPVLHTLSFSGPCRAVEMLVDVLNLDVEFKTCDLMKGEHLKPEYLKINPHHTVPTLVTESGLSIFESRAIMAYLVNKYAPNSPLYPSDPEKRAVVDQFLNFDGTTLYPTLGFLIYPVIKSGQKFNVELAKMLDDKLALLNGDLGRTSFVAGDDLTIADLSLLATYTCIDSIGKWDTSKLDNINNWVKRVKDSGRIKNYADLVENTSKAYGGWVRSKLDA